MLDTHPGEVPAYVQLITLCVGFIIAFGLQQLVALLQRRRRQKRLLAEEAAKAVERPATGDSPKNDAP